MNFSSFLKIWLHPLYCFIFLPSLALEELGIKTFFWALQKQIAAKWLDVNFREIVTADHT